MKRIVYLFSILIICGQVAFATTAPIKVSFVDANNSLKPGRLETVRLIVEGSSPKGDFTNALTLPAGWELISSSHSPVPAEQNKSVVLLSLVVPTYCEPGNYTVSLNLNNSNSGRTEKLPVLFKVEEFHYLEIKSIADKANISAGDEMTASFSIQNMGNTIEVLTLHSPGSTLDQEVVQVMPDSTVNVQVTRKSEENVTRVSRTVIILQAEADNGAVYTSSVRANVFPSTTQNIDSYFRYPLTASVFYNSYTQKGYHYSSLSYELKGMSYIDQKKHHLLSVSIRFPNQSSLRRFGLNDVYFLNYSNRNQLSISLGDVATQYNRLGFVGRYGFGAAIEKTFNKLTLESYYTRPRLNLYNQFGTVGSKVSYQFTPQFRMGVSMSGSKASGVAAFSNLNQDSLPTGVINVVDFSYQSERTKIVSELSVSSRGDKVDYANYFQFYHTKRYMTFNSSFVRAGQHYAGGLYNSLSTANSLTYSRNQYTLSVGQNVSRVNERLDTSIVGIQPFYDNYFFSVGKRFKVKHFFTVRGESRFKEDRQLGNPLYSYREQSLSYRYRYVSRKYGLSFIGRMGKTRNLLSEDRALANTYGHLVNASWSPSRWLQLRGSVSHNYTNRYGFSSIASHYYLIGGGITLSDQNRFQISASANSGFSPEEAYQQRDFFTLSGLWKISLRQRIEARANYYLRPNETLNNEELFASVKYSYQFNVPVKKLYETAKLELVFESDEDISLEDIRVFSNVETLMTKSDRVKFNALQAGNTTLIIDGKSIPEGYVPLSGTKIKTLLVPGEERVIRVKLVKQATLEGQVLLNDKPLAANAILQLNSDQGTQYVNSNAQGEFRFDHLAPGKYKLSLYRLNGNIQFQKQQDYYIVQISEGVAHEKSIQLIEEKKQVRMSKGTLRIEE